MDGDGKCRLGNQRLKGQRTKEESGGMAKKGGSTNLLVDFPGLCSSAWALVADQLFDLVTVALVLCDHAGESGHDASGVLSVGYI